MSILAAHDINGALLDALSASDTGWPNVFAGVLCVDPLRPTAQLIQRLKDAGVAGAINFPSVSFIDGEAGAVFDRLSLGIDREINFLRACAVEGLRVGGVTRSVEAAQKLLDISVDFLLAHGGAPTRDNSDPSKAAATQITAVATSLNVPVIPLSRVLTS